MPPPEHPKGGLLEGFLSAQRLKVANRLIPAEARSGRLLDLGCGEHARFLVATSFAEKHGVDRRRPHADLHSSTYGITRTDCDFEVVERLPFDDGYFDVVTMLAVFEHIEPAKLPAIVAEIRRVLKPGGMCILTTPAGWTDRILRAMAAVRIVDPVQIAEHKDVYSHAKVAGILEAGGFARDRMRFGYFEVVMNIWATARK